MSISFSLKFDIKPFKIINAESKILLCGSCFTENIGEYLLNSGFETSINPFGIIYNPFSISNSLNYIIDKKQFCEADLFFTHEKRYVSFEHHGWFSGFEKLKVLDEINLQINNAHNFLKTADCLIITLGTAWAYKHLKQNKIVANCHKIPAIEFKKELLEIETICESLTAMIEKLIKFNKNIKIIFTISPVKHLADGIVENQQSKATLILSVKNLIEKYKDFSFYFPAYEIVTDELRDYRFYENDHAHPTTLATEYVWERFVDSCFDNEAKGKMGEALKIGKYINHRQISANKSPNEDFIKRINLFLKKYNK